MRRWLISDTHFGHSALMRHTRRPADVDQRIRQNWLKLVDPNDLVIHLGDFCFTNTKLDQWLVGLPGRKVLVRGNHDSKTVSAYMNAGFDFCCDEFRMGAYLFTHQPKRHLPEDIQFNFHGHWHIRVPHYTMMTPHHVFFSLEYEDYRPRILEKFLKEQLHNQKTLLTA